MRSKTKKRAKSKNVFLRSTTLKAPKFSKMKLYLLGGAFLAIGVVYAFVASAAVAPITVKFSPQTHVGIKELTADGTQLLTGCGFGFIGSIDGVDDTDNLSTCVSGGQPLMKPLNNGTARLSHQLHFVDEGVPGKIRFAGEVGSAQQAMKAISMPMDARRDLCTHFRSSGDPTVRAYANNPYKYSIDLGKINIWAAGKNNSWGEIICGKYIIRVSLDPTSPRMNLYFVDHPSTRNVEFSFDTLAKGEKKYVAGWISVRYNEVLTTKVYQAESKSFYHQIGKAEAEGWSASVKDAPNRYLMYGPYTTAITPGKRTATYRVMFDNVTADNSHLLTLDAYDAKAGKVLASKKVYRNDLKKAMTYQDIALAFEANKTSNLEFRVYYYGGTYVRVDSVTVK